MTFDADTLRFYAQEAPDYAASGAGYASQYLPQFLERLPESARILELGCGGGRDSAAMLAAGYDVDATDGVPEMAAQAELRTGRAVRVMRFDELQARLAYDGVWASASLLHVPRTSLPDILLRIHLALLPGGIHAASYKAGEQEGRDEMGRYFNYMSRPALLAAYDSAGAWQVLDVTEGLGGGYDGRQGPWVNVTLQKAG